MYTFPQNRAVKSGNKKENAVLSKSKKPMQSICVGPILLVCGPHR